MIDWLRELIADFCLTRVNVHIDAIDAHAEYVEEYGPGLFSQVAVDVNKALAELWLAVLEAVEVNND